MAEGNPTRALERSETVRMPPVIYLQGNADIAHPAPDRERFIARYTDGRVIRPTLCHNSAGSDITSNHLPTYPLTPNPRNRTCTLAEN